MSEEDSLGSQKLKIESKYAFPTRDKKDTNKLKSLDQVLTGKQQLPPK